jgi:hypothetical protein
MKAPLGELVAGNLVSGVVPLFAPWRLRILWRVAAQRTCLSLVGLMVRPHIGCPGRSWLTGPAVPPGLALLDYLAAAFPPQTWSTEVGGLLLWLSGFNIASARSVRNRQRPVLQA